MRYKATDNKLYFTRGTASTMVDNTKVPVDYIYYNDPSCGYYIDPRGFLVLPDFNSVSGDKVTNALYIVDGVVTVKPLADVIAAVNTYCKNKLVSATGVSITGCPDQDLAEVSETVQLTAVVTPSGASQAGTWVSSAPGKATVSSSGLVTAVSTGTTVIKFTSTDGSFEATCEINVNIQ